jgi:diaminopimelate epimerase
MEFKAFKMDGLGNDFVIIDRRKNPISIVKEKIIELGKRDNIGFDQLIFLDEIDPQAPNYIPITIFNSDGEEVEACGNGSRCVAKLICDEKKIEHTAVLAGDRVLKAQKISENSIRIVMGDPIFSWQKIPLSKNIDCKNINLKIGNEELKDGYALNVGNPHIVFFVEDCYKYNLKKIGPLIENHELFPEKINVTFAQIKDSSNIWVNVWERGAGQTKACGTAACATGVVAFEKKIAGNNNNIHFKEGFLNIEYDGIISMTGPVSDIKEIKIKL